MRGARRRAKSGVYRRYRDLPNGQVAMFYALRVYNAHGEKTWYLGIAIGRGRKEVRLHMRGAFARTRKGRCICDETTGNCGLRGLIAIKELLEEFLDWVAPRGRRVNVAAIPYDNKRKKAYEYLVRLGFKKYYLPDYQLPSFWLFLGQID